MREQWELYIGFFERRRCNKLIEEFNALVLNNPRASFYRLRINGWISGMEESCIETKLREKGYKIVRQFSDDGIFFIEIE